MESIINLYLAQNLKALRKKSNKKQLEMALIFNIKQQNYSKFENGKTNFTNKLIDKICETFHITAVEFIAGQHVSQNQLKANATEELTTKILLANLQKQLTEKKLQIVEMEIANRMPKQKRGIANGNNPVYVMI